jgi:hypothetical protein
VNKKGTKTVSYFMISIKELLLPILVSFLLPPTLPIRFRFANLSQLQSPIGKSLLFLKNVLVENKVSVPVSVSGANPFS